MKLTCDLCGGVLKSKAEGAVCSCCGLEYGADRLKEKTSLIQSIEKKPAKDFSKKEQKRFKLMWKLFGIICVIAFVGVLMASTPEQEALLFGSCVLATILDFVILMPRNKKGEKNDENHL